MSDQYKMVAENPLSTVVADYEPRYRSAKQYQSEAEMEKEFIEQLRTQAYDYLPITSEKELVANLRVQLERLNDYRFTDREWTAFFKEKIANQNNGIVEKTAIVQEDHIQLLTREDGTVKNIYLIDKDNIHNKIFIAKNRSHEVYGKHIVMIFDECHRSQFGEMHTAIVKKFKKYHLFGFTGKKTELFKALFCIFLLLE